MTQPWWEDPAERARWISTIEKWRERARDTGAYFVLDVAPEFVGVPDARRAVRLFDETGPMAMPAPLANLLGSPRMRVDAGARHAWLRAKEGAAQ